MTTGKLELSGGIVAANVPVDGYLDAAISSGSVGAQLAGIELAIESVVVHVGTDPTTQRADPLLVLALDPPTMHRLALLLCEKLGVTTDPLTGDPNERHARQHVDEN